MLRIRNVKVLENFRVQLELSNGEQKTIDLEPFLHGPIFEPLRKSPKLFRTVTVDKAIGTIVWQNGADIDPDVLIGKEKAEWVTKHSQRTSVSTALTATSVKEPAAAYKPRRKAKGKPRTKHRSKKP